MVAQTQKETKMKNIKRLTVDYFCLSINDMDQVERANTECEEDVQITVISRNIYRFWVSQEFAKSLFNRVDHKYTIVVYEDMYSPLTEADCWDGDESYNALQ